MKYFHYLTVFAITLLLGLFTSCVPKDEAPEEATLSLSATAVTIANTGGDAQPIIVTTNQTKWNAISNAEWLTSTVTGNTLTIAATPNQGGTDRAAEVLIVAGNTSEKVSVIQSAADVVLEVSPNNIVVTNAGETKLVSVKSNSATWTLEVDEAASAWISKSVFKDFIQLEIAPNSGASRETKLYAKSGAVQKEITIQQAGTNSNPFILPYLVIDAEPYQLISYETSKGSFLLSYSAPTAGSLFEAKSGAVYTFATSSSLFPGAFYLFKYETGLLDVVQYVGTKSTAEVVKAGYVDFLKENGYTDAKYDDTKNLVTGSHSSNRSKVEMSDSKAGKAVVNFYPPVPQQEATYTTFSRFPYDNSDMLYDVKYTSVKVKGIEAAANSNLIAEVEDETYPGNVYQLLYELDPSAAPLHTRLYFFENSKNGADGKPLNNVDQLLALWQDANLGAWEFKPGTFYLTNEFKTLMTDEGFVHFKTDADGTDFFYNAAKKLMIVPRGARFAEVLSGQPVFTISYFQYEVAGSSTNAREKAIERFAAIIKAQDKALGKL